MKRTLSMLLALLTVGGMLVSCAADGGSPDSTTTAANADTDASGETTSADPYADDLPDDLDFEGEEFVFYVGGYQVESYYIGSEEESGDVVQDTTIARNRAVEERLNIKLNISINGTSDTYDHNPHITNLILSGDETYDLISYQQFRIVQLATNDYFINVNELDYVDFEKPYWNLSYMDGLTLNPDKRVFLVGDYIIESLLSLRVTFYNKAMYADRYGDPDGLYNIVLDGGWTIDKMAEIIAETYEDLNSDGKTDISDRVGLVSWTLSGGVVDPFIYGTDIKFLTRNSDGSVDLSIMSNDAVNLAEKLNGMLNSRSNFVVNTHEEQFSVFKSDHAQFVGFGRFSDADVLRDMESDFGFLPPTKFDEEQEEYNSLIHDTVCIAAVPVTSTSIDKIGAVLEALNSESSETVLPTWYDTALKVKYARDDISSQMIDIIRGSATTSFIYVYNYALNNVGLIYRTLVKNNSNNFASEYATLEPAALEKLATLTDYFNS